jgi:hypothetical protein
LSKAKTPESEDTHVLIEKTPESSAERNESEDTHVLIDAFDNRQCGKRRRKAKTPMSSLMLSITDSDESEDTHVLIDAFDNRQQRLIFSDGVMDVLVLPGVKQLEFKKGWKIEAEKSEKRGRIQLTLVVSTDRISGAEYKLDPTPLLLYSDPTPLL